MKKTILKLNLGINSIGWALVKQDFEIRMCRILMIFSKLVNNKMATTEVRSRLVKLILRLKGLVVIRLSIQLKKKTK